LATDEDFWDDLLAHLRAGVLVPVVGPGLALVDDGARRLPLAQRIGERLAERYKLEVPPDAGLDAAVRAFLAARGRDQLERLYRIVNDILVELDPAPSEPLRRLAAIEDLNLFVSTTFDGLLARAIDAERFGGAPTTQQFWFAPNQSTDAQQANARPPGAGPVVFKLFGESSSVPQFALHDEDTLEWLHALLSETARLPDWIEHALKERPLLLLGCQIPDWVGRYLLRLASTTRLAVGKKQFFIVGSDLARYPELTSFFRSYCSPTAVQWAEMAPADFVAELERRWRARRPVPAPAAAAGAAAAESGSIFISYAREDVQAARRLAQAIGTLGGDVWLDERRLAPGDRWEGEILEAIRRRVRMVVPIVSAATEKRDEGYVFKEWEEAAERARGIPRRRFIVPVAVDQVGVDVGRLVNIPEAFRKFNFGRAPAGEPDTELLEVLKEEIRGMRREAA
jgi:hypothetical protein